MILRDVYHAGEQGVMFLYHLIAERMTEPEVNISATMPTMDEHRAFMARRDYRFWFLIEIEGEWVGYVSATYRNEIGIVLVKKHRGKGYGPQAVQLLVDRFQPLHAMASVRAEHWLANINPKNARSIAMFEKLGFEHIQNTYALKRGETA